MDYIEVVRILQKIEDDVLSWEDGRDQLIAAYMPEFVIDAIIGKGKP